MMVTAVLAAQYAGTLDLLDSTRIDGRASDPAVAVTVGDRPEKVIVAADFTNTASARLRLRDRRWDYSLSYSPSLTAPDLELALDPPPTNGTNPAAPAVLQTFGASIAWHDRFVAVIVSESGSMGALSTALPYQLPATAQAADTPGQTTTPNQGTTPNQPTNPSQPTTPAQPTNPGAMNPGQTLNPGQSAGSTGNGGQANLLLRQGTILYGASNTNVAIAARLGRRTTAYVGGGYAFGGGLDANARLALPEQFGPSATASVGHTISPTDTLSVAASGQYTITSGLCAPGQAPQTNAGPFTTTSAFCRTIVPAAQALGGFHRQLSTTSTLSLNAGASVDVIDNPNGSSEVAILPSGGVIYSNHFAGRGLTNLLVSGQIIPVVDILTGLPNARFENATALSGPVYRNVLVTLSAGFTRSLPIPSNRFPITALSGGADVRVRMSVLFDLVFGEQTFWQYQAGFPPPLVTAIGYVGVTARAPTLHF
jgi:hypothetical protein